MIATGIAAAGPTPMIAGSTPTVAKVAGPTEGNFLSMLEVISIVLH